MNPIEPPRTLHQGSSAAIVESENLILKPKRNENVETRLLPDGHVVLFSKSSDWAHTISPLGAIVWEFCDGENTVEQITKHVREVSKNSDGMLGEQIETLIKEFEKSGLILFESHGKDL